MSVGHRETRGGSGDNGRSAEAGETVSEPMRRVVEALLDGATPAPTDREALTDAERAELNALLRTASLTRVAIQAESPDPAAEQASLDRAQSDLQKRVATGTLPAPSAHLPASDSGLRAWLDRLLGRDTGRDKGTDRDH